MAAARARAGPRPGSSGSGSSSRRSSTRSARSGQPALEHWLVVAGAVTFSAIYVALVLNWIDEDRPLRSYSLAGLQLALAVALTVGDQVSLGVSVLLLRGVHWR